MQFNALQLEKKHANRQNTLQTHATQRKICGANSENTNTEMCCSLCFCIWLCFYVLFLYTWCQIVEECLDAVC